VHARVERLARALTHTHTHTHVHTYTHTLTHTHTHTRAHTHHAAENVKGTAAYNAWKKKKPAYIKQLHAPSP